MARTNWATYAIAIAILGSGLSACGGGGSGGGEVRNTLKQPLARVGNGGAFQQAAGTSCSADTSEQNDEPGQRKPLAFDQPQVLNFCDDAVDFFTLTVVPGRTYTIETSALESAVDTVLQLQRPDGQLISENDDTGNTFASSLSVTVPAALTEVVVMVRQFSAAAVGANTGYVLTALDQAQSSRPDFVFDGFTISGFADTRTFEFEAKIDNLGSGFGTPTVAFYLSEDAQFNRSQDRFFAEAFAQQIAPGQSENLRGFLSVPNDTVGEFFIFLVLDDQNLIAELSETNNSERLAAPSRFFASNIGNCHEDVFEPDDVPAVASRINPGQGLEARHCSDGLDIFFFDAAARRNYTISTTFLDKFTDTLVEIVDPAGTVLASNDDFAGLGSRVNVSVETAQQLLIRVASQNDFGSQGSYTLNLVEDDSRPDLVASVTNASAGLTAGAQATLTVLVANGGATTAGPSEIALDVFCNPLNQLDPAVEFAESIVVTAQIPQLAAGAQTTLTPQVTIPAGARGDCLFRAYADATNVVAESVDATPGTLGRNAGSPFSAAVAGAGTTAKHKEPNRASRR